MSRKGKIALVSLFGVLAATALVLLFQMDSAERVQFLALLKTNLVDHGLVPAAIVTLFIVVPVVALISRWEAKHPVPRCPKCGQALPRDFKVEPGADPVTSVK